MRVAVYSPYLDTYGGGEKYLLTAAECLSSGHQVDLLIDTHLQTLNPKDLKQKLAKRFNLDLSMVNLVNAPFGKKSFFHNRYLFLKKYDLVFSFTDGSLFYSSAKKSVLHIQTPLKNISKNSFWGRKKLASWDLIIYNSKFTQKNSEAEWKIPSQVVYPPVDVGIIKPLNKKKYILSVGRFFGFLREKKHEVMIEAFKQLYSDKKARGWSLHLVGSAGEGDRPYLEELAKMIGDVPVFLHPNLPFGELVKFYGRSSIYWHAMGYEETDPTKMEHFGITTVEAMAGGGVPIVIKKGGQLEIIEEGVSGLFWEDIDQLNKETLNLIKNNKKMQSLSEGAVIRSAQFSKKIFEQKINQLAGLL